ncbi:MAG TPA: PAS domain-containing sensor histidine kinase [Flavisolibacter sp.]
MEKTLLNGAEGYLDLVTGMVLGLDVSGTVVFINSQGCRLLEAEKKDVIGHNWFTSFLSAENRDEIRALFHDLVTAERYPPQFFESSIRTLKGNTQFISWYNTIILKERGIVTGILSFGENISEKKILQQRLAMLEEIRRQQLVSAVLEAQEKERSEIAYELHDNVNQILTTCKLLLEQEIHNGNHSPFIENTTRYIQDAIDEIRNISHRLNPAHLKEMSFEQAIREMTQNINLSGRINIEVSISGQEYLDQLPAPVALSVFRILQEHLTNVIKHSRADKAEMVIQASDQSIDVEVKDNGIGFDLKNAAKGIGLKSIYSRVELHNGSVYFNTAPGEGCFLSIYIPYERSRQRKETESHS